MAIEQVIKRLMKGAGAQALSQGVQIIIRLAEIPLFLGFWGAHRYGEWLIVAAIPSWISIADGGFATTTGRDMTMRVAAGDRDGALASFQSSWVLLLGIVVSLAFIFGGLLFAPMVDGWMPPTADGTLAVKLAIFLLLTHVLVGFQAGLIYGAYTSEGRYALGTTMAAATQLTEFVGMAIAVAAGGHIEHAAMGLLAGRCIGLTLNVYVLRRTAPWIHFGWKLASWSYIRKLAAPALSALAFPLGNALNIQGLRLLVGATLGAEAVAIFSTLRTLTRSALQPVSIITRLIEPELAMAFGSSDESMIRQLVRKGGQVAFWLSGGLCLFVLLLGPTILRIWTHGKIAMDWADFAILLSAAAVNGLWTVSLQVAYATNRTQKIALIYTGIYGLGSFAIAWLGIKLLGLPGAAVGLLSAELAMCFQVIPMSLRMTGDSWSDWVRAVLRPPLRDFERLWLRLRSPLR